MSSVRRLLTIIAALFGVLAIIGSHLALQLKDTAYLNSVAARAGTSRAVALALPAYAANKLPDPEVASKTFSQNVTSADVTAVIQGLHDSIADAYDGKTDVVELSLQPIVQPVMAGGYQIPPGTIFANQTVQVGGLASVLRLASRSLLPVILCFAVTVLLVIMLGAKQGFARSLRGVTLFMALFMLGVFAASFAMPFLVNTLVASSGLDVALRAVVGDYITVIAKDAGRYYLLWAGALLFGSAFLATITAARRKPKKSHHQLKDPKPKVDDSSKTVEPW